MGDKATAQTHAKFLKDKKVRVDIFGLREGADRRQLPGPAPARRSPRSSPGQKYLVEVVVRTLGVGHPLHPGHGRFQRDLGRADRPPGDRVIGRSGGIGPDGAVDPYSHFINVYMLDRDGNRIDRRNAQDIFVPLYNKQIPPGAGQVVHFAPGAPRGPDRPDHARGQGQLPQV